MANQEAVFQNIVLRKLRDIPGLWVTTKEAASIRGLPDLFGCYYGHFFGWELKVNLRETRRKTGRIVLQRHTLQQIRKAGGIGEFVCPENLDEKIAELLTLTPKLH